MNNYHQNHREVIVCIETAIVLQLILTFHGKHV